MLDLFPFLYWVKCFAAAAFLAAFVYAASTGFYNVYLHPLSKFPGSKWYALSHVLFLYHEIVGSRHNAILRLHQKYGPVVRIAPNQLAFSRAEAWKDIMGHQSGGNEFPKDDLIYRPGRLSIRPQDIIYSDRKLHGVLRRQLAHGFSAKSMKEQEPLIQQYIDLLISRLREKGNGAQTALPMEAWFNFLTFDVIGDLAFGEPFDCLLNSDYHEWVKNIFEVVQTTVYLHVEHIYPFMKRLVTMMVPQKRLKQGARHLQLNTAKLQRRMAAEPRSDLIHKLLADVEAGDMTMAQLESNSRVLVQAGSETTAAALSAAIYYLMANPHTLARLNDEIRTSFKQEADITIESAGRLPYMLACLDETMRIHPPVASALPRTVPKGGAVITGTFVPENTIVGIHHWPAYHLEDNFKLPFEFHPERFLGDAQFAGDNLGVFQPFHVGPRNCLGKNLAYAEMRLVLARLIFNFDMELSPQSVGWASSLRVFTIWERKPLLVYLKPREVSAKAEAE